MSARDDRQRVDDRSDVRLAACVAIEQNDEWLVGRRPTPAQFGDRVGWHDAVIGNPPFVRYQRHRGVDRKRSAAAAMAQGVRLSSSMFF